MVEQSGVRATRSNLRQVGLQRLDRTMHLLFGGVLDVIDHALSVGSDTGFPNDGAANLVLTGKVVSDPC